MERFIDIYIWNNIILVTRYKLKEHQTLDGVIIQLYAFYICNIRLL